MLYPGKKRIVSIIKVFKNKQSELLSSIFVVSLLMIVASVLMYGVESKAQPDVFRNAFDALWWALTTLTTVGYGDIYPITVFGKILSAVYSAILPSPSLHQQKILYMHNPYAVLVAADSVIHGDDIFWIIVADCF